MRTDSVHVLADRLLAIDGLTLPLSEPLRGEAAGGRRRELAFGLPPAELERAMPLVGLSGVVHTRRGVVLMRLRVLRVDPERGLLYGEPTR